ncbi:hypothetical protein C6P45_001141 [Maudiozyma exigua]|uniref:RRM domain-containing protein n=1 Tax=Maudiozyma exigua TaxID=34358 RepID=A0A9P7B789_MAUEX|nr:hypothetical protein C6P45_001141 [Kazachstania exigua]
MSMYNLSKYPNDVAQLFEPMAPLPYRKPIDYPPQKRRTNPNISPVSNVINSSQFAMYKKQYPKGSRNGHLSPQSKLQRRTERNNELLQKEFERWDPKNDPHMSNTDPYRTIFVGRLPYGATEVDLQKAFGGYGSIELVRVVRDKESKSRGYGFVVFSDPMVAKLTTRECGVHRGIEILGRRCIVDIERGRTVTYFKPRRLGGGLGGRGYIQQQTQSREQYNRHSYAQQSRPQYSGPSRFAREPTLRSTGQFEESSVSTTSYKSRNTRNQGSDTKKPTEMIDY